MARLEDRVPVKERRGLKEGDIPVGTVLDDHYHKHWNGDKQQYDKMVVTDNGIMPESCAFIWEYPHLYISGPHKDGALWLYKRRVHTWGEGYTWDGLAGDGEPLGCDLNVNDPDLHAKLKALEEKCAPASQPGHFLCSTCGRDRTDLAGTNFNAHYCQECYDTNPSAKARVEEAKRPNYYE